MRIWMLAATTLALAAGIPLAAQDVNLGLGIMVGLPTGALDSTSYPDGATEAYSSGLGAKFTASWPVAHALAVRLNVSGITFNGTGSAPQTYNWNVQDSMFSVGGEAEYFLPDGSAERHLGTYLVGGLHSSFERFSASNYDPGFYPATTLEKTRLAATAGLGHTFRAYRRTRWSLEAVYHKTLTGTSSNDAALVGFPASDYVELYTGFVF